MNSPKTTRTTQDANGRAVHQFALEMDNLGLAKLADRILAMLKSGTWQSFKDGYGQHEFLPGEFDYFLTQQGITREQLLHGLRNIADKAELEKAMDERRTGDSTYRRSLPEVRANNPEQPNQPILPFGYSAREARFLDQDGATLPKSKQRPALGTSVRRYTVTGGRTSKSAAQELPKVERLRRSAARLPPDELDQLIVSLIAVREHHSEPTSPNQEAAT